MSSISVGPFMVESTSSIFLVSRDKVGQNIGRISELASPFWHHSSSHTCFRLHKIGLRRIMIINIQSVGTCSVNESCKLLKSCACKFCRLSISCLTSNFIPISISKLGLFKFIFITISKLSNPILTSPWRMPLLRSWV